jgi:hypothetical protein
LVEQHELQVFVVGRQDEQVVDGAFAQHPGQVVAGLGGQRPGLPEDDPEEALLVLGQQFQLLSRR